MKLSSKAKLNIIFYSITIPVMPIVVLMLFFSIILSLVPRFNQPVLNWVEKRIQQFAIWRNNLPIVKNAYDKVHLFDYIKESS